MSGMRISKYFHHTSHHTYGKVAWVRQRDISNTSGLTDGTILQCWEFTLCIINSSSDTYAALLQLCSTVNTTTDPSEAYENLAAWFYVRRGLKHVPIFFFFPKACLSACISFKVRPVALATSIAKNHNFKVSLLLMSKGGCILLESTKCHLLWNAFDFLCLPAHSLHPFHPFAIELWSVGTQIKR